MSCDFTSYLHCWLFFSYRQTIDLTSIVSVCSSNVRGEKNRNSRLHMTRGKLKISNIIILRMKFCRLIIDFLRSRRTKRFSIENQSLLSIEPDHTKKTWSSESTINVSHLSSFCLQKETHTWFSFLSFFVRSMLS